MVTPMVSFATTDDTSSDTTTDNTQQEAEIDTSDTVAPEKTEAERKAEALANAVVAQKQESINGHDFVTASNEYELYLKKDNLSILLRNIKTGAILESTITQETADERGYSNQITPYLTSGFAVKTLSSESKTRFSAAKEMAWIGAKDAVLDYTTIDNGFKCHFSYENYGIEFDINITLDNEGLHVDVPESGKKENNEKYYIGEVYLFPLLGYTDLGDRDGYMFLPDGNGITVNFENFWNAESPKYASGYVQRIYGYDISYDLTTESGDVNAVNNVTIPVIIDEINADIVRAIFFKIDLKNDFHNIDKEVLNKYVQNNGCILHNGEIIVCKSLNAMNFNEKNDYNAIFDFFEKDDFAVINVGSIIFTNSIFGNAGLAPYFFKASSF